MNIVPIEDTFWLMSECFPDLDQQNLVQYRDQFVALMFWDIACCLCYPYKNGLAISYLGVTSRYRGTGYASKILEQMSDYAGKRPVYAEVIPNSVMYIMLQHRGWYHIPIPYVCPPWGSEPPDDTRCLMCSKRDADHIAFIKEFYEVGYRVTANNLIAKYKKALRG